MMAANATRSKAALAGIALALGLMAVPLQSSAQVSSYGDKTEGQNVGDQLPTVLEKVQVTQHLNGQLPMDAEFVDDTGAPVKLGKYFDGKHPVLVTTVYYNCPMLCSEEMDGITSALEMVHLVPGKDFQIVIISIDPSETPQLAAQKKAFYLKRYGHPATASGWHYLTGKSAAIDAVTKAIGFGYVRVPGPDGRLTQFAHASAIEIATPQGKLAQYYLGVEYSPKDVLLGLIDASGNKIGSPVANILTYCYHYDPQTNKHSLMVVRVVQLGGIVTVASLGSFIFLMFRRDIKLAHEQDTPQPEKDETGETDEG
ncbi:MAG TPA: SCO family protein [Acidobacteriaceae bacterium]